VLHKLAQHLDGPRPRAAMVLLIFWAGFRYEDRAADAPVPKGEVVSTSFCLKKAGLGAPVGW